LLLLWWRRLLHVNAVTSNVRLGGWIDVASSRIGKQYAVCMRCNTLPIPLCRSNAMWVD
jgi:hypothetical protein